jgi:hypothetical protein
MKFGGDGKFISMTSGFEIRDQTIFTVSQKSSKNYRFDRPREGDLVFLPLDKKCYEIKFVEHQDIFYQLGRLISWDIQCELMEYNGQQFATGIADIDIISTKFDMDDTEENRSRTGSTRAQRFSQSLTTISTGVRRIHSVVEVRYNVWNVLLSRRH